MGRGARCRCAEDLCRRERPRDRAALDEAFDVGLFTAEPGKKEFDQSDVILFERRPIHSGMQTLQFVTAREPSFGGVDPYNKRVDRNSEDNVSAIESAR